ncbi:VOC family protein [Marinigracilibium pacificum]|uniref:Glyoxalase n=1 Tax=Marinigracilibium pacificum TaxID=2729599 RepID=A0A848IWJ7_9BACT|nr:VOC family protein [Marinigracilibium pacificum]NMM47538.1 glyoxalase [Marinigracilibium pacificum]
MKHMISHGATILHVNDINKSIEFYVQKIGFTSNFTWEIPITYAILSAGDRLSIHLSKKNSYSENKNPIPIMYIFVENIDSYYSELIKNNTPIHNPIGNRDYQMRDFDIIDPDGYLLTFGQGL